MPQYKAAEISYSICWVISRMKTSLDSEAIRVSDFTKWIEKNKANLPTNLPPSEEVCKDLSSTGHFMYLPNKEDPSNGWLVLDLPFILHKVYGTLFSPSKKIVNKFGLLNCQELSVLFPALDQGMVRDVLTNLEFCIDVNPSILAEEVTQLTERPDKDHDHLFFPALVSSQPPKVFPHSQQGCHVLSWQLVVVRRPFISPRLLQTIILRLAARRVFHCKQDSHTREHYCSVWCNGIFWQSNEDVDVAVQISDSTIVELIGRSEVSPEVLCSYVSTIAGDISATIRELSPSLSATAYIIHPANPQVLLENPRSPSSHEKFPVDIIPENIRNVKSTCLSCKVEEEPATRKPISDLFCGFVPKEDVIRHLSFVSGEFVCLCVCIHVNCDVCYCIVLHGVMCVVCYLNIQQLYFILQCTICSVLSSICLCMYCTYVHVYHCIVLLHCSSVCNSCTSIVHCECVLLYCSKYCTSYSILPGTTAPHPRQVFDCEAFMDKFKDRFLQSVDSHAIVLRLEIEKVISGKLSHSIKNQHVGDGNQELFLYLRRQADPGSIRKLCDVMVREEGYAMMNELGRDMRRELDLLTGVYVHVVM